MEKFPQRFNINTQVRVELTDYGLKILKDTSRSYMLDEKRYGKNAIETELWHLMQIFGHVMFNGNPYVPFVGNKIALPEKSV